MAEGSVHPDAQGVPWHEKFSREAIIGAERDMTPTIRTRLDLDRLWREAFDEAMCEIPRRMLGVPPSIPRACPFALDELLSEEFTYDRAVERLYVLLTSWRPKTERNPQT